VPLPPDGSVATQVRFSDPVALLRLPHRVSFAYAAADLVWQGTWRDSARLPSAVRITVRDAATEQMLAVSTAALIRVAVPAECISAKDPALCK